MREITVAFDSSPLVMKSISESFLKTSLRLPVIRDRQNLRLSHIDLGLHDIHEVSHLFSLNRSEHSPPLLSIPELQEPDTLPGPRS